MHRQRFSIAGSKSGNLSARTMSWWTEVNEPNLVIGAEFPENYAEADSNVLAQAVKNYLIESFPPVPKLRLLNGITEFEAWKLMESKRPGHIILDVGNVRNNLDMACRLARRQHGQGGTYAMYLDPKQGSYFEKHHGWQHAIKELPNFDGADQFWMLNMVCHGTSFQLCERVKSKEPQRSGQPSRDRGGDSWDGPRCLLPTKEQNCWGTLRPSALTSASSCTRSAPELLTNKDGRNATGRSSSLSESCLGLPSSKSS